MSTETVEVLVVGGGQAGLAMSEHLAACGVPHLVLERHRIAERWRSERWDSLVANGPAWHDRFPALEFSDIDPDAFASKDRIVDYLVAYAEKIAAPVRCGVEVDVGAPERGPRRASACRRPTGRSRPATWSRRPDRSNSRRSRRSFPTMPGPRRCTRAPTAIRISCPRVPSWSSEPDRPACRSPTSCCGAGRRVYLSVGPHDRPPSGIADATSSGGSASLANGMQRLLRRARSTSPSRSAGPTAATPSTSATLTPGCGCSPGPRPRSNAAPSGSHPTSPGEHRARRRQLPIAAGRS